MNFKTNFNKAILLNRFGFDSVQLSLPWSTKFDSNLQLAFLCFITAKKYLVSSTEIDDNIRQLHNIIKNGTEIEPSNFQKDIGFAHAENYKLVKQDNSQKTITFLAGDNDNFTFIKPVMKYLEKRNFIIKTYLSGEINDDNTAIILEQSDLIWYEWGNGPVVQMSKLYKNCPSICRIHRYEAYQNSVNLINWHNIDKLILINKVVLDVILEKWDSNLGYKTNIEIIPNPVPVSVNFRIRENNYNIAYISRFHKDKNPVLMIMILNKLVTIDRRYKVYMAGSIQDSPLFNYCINLIDKLGLKDNFIYEGFIDNINEWLEDKSFLLSTSVVESQGLAIMEAMAMGIKPVIYNGLGLDSIYPGDLLFNTEDEAVNLITGTNYNSADYRKLIEKGYSNEIILPKIEKIINGLINTSYNNRLNSTSDKTTTPEVCSKSYTVSILYPYIQ